MSNDEIIKKVAHDFNLVVRNYDEASLAIDRKVLQEASFVIGREVLLGKYKNESVRLASFFHEVGHVLEPKCNIDGITDLGVYKFTCEKDAWDKGIALAKKYDVVFSKEALQFMVRCLYHALKYRG